jgi:hypothetical protein
MIMKEDFEFLRGLANCEDKEQMARYIEEHQPKPMTNADRIRAMTDEELVVFINTFNICDNRTNFECKFNYGADCSECVLDWLRQPVEENDNGQG